MIPALPELLLLRHGQTEWNREGRFQGHLDPALSADGRLEAELVAERIAADAALRPARIISSPLGPWLRGAALASSCSTVW